MTKKQRALLIKKILSQYFPDPLPPLNYTDPFSCLIAVLLSAHTTDKAVNSVTPILFKKGNTVKKMAALSQKEIESIIRPVGLFKRKAKAIVELCQMLIKDFKSQVPPSLKELEKLPGVGHKTASVVISQIFKKPAFPVDTHIHRVAKRWKLSSGKNREETEKDLKKLFAKNDWGKLHLQMILFARKFCQAKGHVIEECPICRKLFFP